MLLLNEFTHDGADCIYQAIAAGETKKRIKAILRPYEAIGSTNGVDFETSRPVYTTDPDKCHISPVVADTNTWEQKMAQVLESMEEVDCYVKNQGLGFFIPYTYNGQQRNYQPDFIVRINDGHGDLLNFLRVIFINLLEGYLKMNDILSTLFCRRCSNFHQIWDKIELV